MPTLGHGRTHMPRDNFGQTVIDSLGAVWALVCRISGSGNLEERLLEPSELEGEDEGYQLVDSKERVAEVEAKSRQ